MAPADVAAASIPYVACLESVSPGAVVQKRLVSSHAKTGDPDGGVRGRGLMWGLQFGDRSLARRVCTAAFERGLLVESSGPFDEVVKVMPPLTISDADLDEGLDILDDAVLAASNDQH